MLINKGKLSHAQSNSWKNIIEIVKTLDKNDQSGQGAMRPLLRMEYLIYLSYRNNLFPPRVRSVAKRITDTPTESTCPRSKNRSRAKSEALSGYDSCKLLESKDIANQRGTKNYAAKTQSHLIAGVKSK